MPSHCAHPHTSTIWTDSYVGFAMIRATFFTNQQSQFHTL